MERRVGPVIDRRHGFGDDGALVSLLTDAGFEDVRAEVRSRHIRFPDGTAFVRLNTMALIGMSARSREMSEEERAGMVAAIVKESEGPLLGQRSGSGPR